MQAVIAEADLSAGALYLYFKSKDEIIAAIGATTLQQVSAQFEPLLDAADLPPPAEALTRLLESIVRLDREQHMVPLAIQVWGEAQRSPRLTAIAVEAQGRVRGLLARLVIHYQATGAIDPAVAPESVARVWAALIMGCMLQHALLGDTDVAAFQAGLQATVRDRGAQG